MGKKVSNYIVEHVCGVSVPQGLGKRFLEANGQNLPPIIFPELRVLTADKKTKNRTFYPESSLRGNANEGTGLISFTRPYPIPVIRDHLTGGSSLFGSEMSSEVYGRVFEPAQFHRENSEGFIRALPSITHQDAIEGILTGRWLTVSLGSQAESVTCSVCEKELTSEGCEHERGEMYEVDGQQKECYWIIGAIRAKEISFVISPSDDQAGVIKPNLQESVLENSISRVLVGTHKGGLVDLATGVKVEEHYNPLLLESPTRIFGFRRATSQVEKQPATLVEKEKKMSKIEDEALKGNVSESDNSNESDTPVTLGQLYLLWDDDPDYGNPDDADENQQEAKLTYSARQKLPDSAFCGPNRSFPAHDAAHVRNGLARLPQSKLSPAQKAKVLSCLRNRAKKYGIKVNSENFVGIPILPEEQKYAARLVDTSYKIDIDLYGLPTSEKELEDVLVKLNSIPHTPAEKQAILSRISAHSKSFLGPAKWQEAFGDLSSCESGEPVTIEVNETNYGLVYSVMKYVITDDKEYSGASDGGAAYSVGDLVKPTVPHEEGHANTTGRIAEVHVGPYYAVKFESSDDDDDDMGGVHKWYAEQELATSDKKEVDNNPTSESGDCSCTDAAETAKEGTKKPDTKEEDLKTGTDDYKNMTNTILGELSKIKDEISKKDTVEKPEDSSKKEAAPVEDDTKKKIASIEATLVKSLATNVATLMVLLDRPQSRGKTREELVDALSKRSLDSLQDAFQDLHVEWLDSQSSKKEEPKKTEIADKSDVDESNKAVADLSALPKLDDPTKVTETDKDVEESQTEDDVAKPKAVLSDLVELPMDEDEEVISIVFSNLRP